MSDTAPRVVRDDIPAEYHSLNDIGYPHPDLLDTIETAALRNLQRGRFANVGLMAYRDRVRGDSDLETAVSDFLGDLRHLCDAGGLDFDSLNYRGQIHYDAEIGGEG